MDDELDKLISTVLLAEDYDELMNCINDHPHPPNKTTLTFMSMNNY